MQDLILVWYNIFSPMVKKFTHALLEIWVVAVLFFPTNVFAIVDPRSVPNNKYGIHIIDENDLENAVSLVNSSRGDFGYVTFVVTIADRNIEKWSKTFKRLEEFHLIPILRIATRSQGNFWEKPKEEDAQTWRDFLSQLPWFTQNRYIVLFNEPNHSQEWGNEINPREYARILKTYSMSLKTKSEDFFILGAGLDASAPNGKATMDEVTFLREMISEEPDIFSYIDGFASHSYPNPGFSGKPTDVGRGTLKTYRWEKQLLTSFGVTKNLPVFITETGWAHKEGIPFRADYYSAADVADFIKTAGDTVWNDPEIVAVTPFILNYQSFPFSHFSWQELDSDRFYPQFDAYRSIPKVAGTPVLILPTLLPSSSVLGQTTKPKNFFTQIFGYLNHFFSTIFLARTTSV